MVEKPLDCRSCGYGICKKLISTGRRPNLASELNIANRIMYTIGVADKKSKFPDADVIIVIMLSATRKSVYFDWGAVAQKRGSILEKNML